MAKVRPNSNGGTTIELGDSDFDKIRELGDRLKDAANPTDDFDPEANMRRIISLNAKVAKLREKHETAKRALKETLEQERATKAKEAFNVAVTELDDFLAEMGREYPLFRPAEPAKV
jgi:hypothetical protein